PFPTRRSSDLSRYWYWNGVNPAALAATVVGAGFYLWTLEPVSWTSPNGLFPYITAGIPSFVLAFGTYAVLMRLFVLSARDAVDVAAATPATAAGSTSTAA